MNARKRQGSFVGIFSFLLFLFFKIRSSGGVLIEGREEIIDCEVAEVATDMDRLRSSGDPGSMFRGVGC